MRSAFWKREGYIPVRLTAIAVAAFFMLSFVPFSHQNGGDSTPATNETYQPIIDKLRSVGDFFTENAGQVANDQVRFYSSGDMQVGFADSAVLLKLVERNENRPLGPFEENMRGQQVFREFTSSGRGVMVRITFEGSNRVTPEGVEEMSHRNNYFIDNDPAKWRTDVRSYRGVLYRDLYDGIDLSYMMQGGRLKYEFLVGPGVDPRLITVSYEGVESVRLPETGELAIDTALGEMKDGKPIAYQDGKMLECTFIMREPLSFGFECDRHDPSRPLVIDPFIYSTFLGGSQQEFFYAEMKIDALDNAYVAGMTRSPDFPVTPGAFDTKYEKAQAFVTKLKADGSSLVYSTFVGAVHNALGLALDSTGSAYICGEGSGPLTPGAYNSGGRRGDAYVARISPQGDSLIFGARIGGDDHDHAIDVDIDGDGNVYLFGQAYSRDFPTTPGAYDTTHNGGTYDLFIAKFNPSASTLLFSTYIGGKEFDYATDMAIDAAGYPYVTGWTGSSDFPTTPGAYDRSFSYYDSYVVKVNVTGSSLIYSTFLNGVEAFGIATDADGYAYVTGRVDEPTFPTTPGAYDTTANGRLDAFVTKFNTHGSGLVYSTRLGASDTDLGWSVIVNSQGHAVLTGLTYSVGFPTTPGALRTCLGGSTEVFVTEFDSEAKSLIYSTYFGGSKHDMGSSIQVDSSGAYIIAGTTVSSDYPVTPGAFDTTYNGGDEYNGDFFVTKLGQTPALNTAPMILSFEASPANEGSPAKFVVNACDVEGDPLTYSFDFESDGTIDVTSLEKAVYQTWGDDYQGTATVSVSDGNLSTTATSSYAIWNVPPLVAVIPPSDGDEGGTFPFLVRVTDPGSDDIIIEWSASCTGLSSSTVYPNNPSSFPDPYPSPEFNPRDITEGQNVTCGDDGVLSWGIRVSDDDGSTIEKDGTFTVENLQPTFSVQPPSLTQVDEGALVTLMVTATDPGSDDLTVSVDLGDGTSDSQIFYNDRVGPDPPNSGPGVFPFAVQVNFTHVYPDDGILNMTVTVEDDDGGSEEKIYQISVLNVAPSVELEVLPIEAAVLLRIAGEKWHDVTIELYEDSTLKAEGSLIRYPGSPNDQMWDLANLDVDILKKYSAIVRYTPEDDPVNGQSNGASPCWIILKFSDGEELWLHHTFNVQNEVTYTWEVDLTQAILMHGITFKATAYDPGADDLTFYWDFGDGANTTGFYPNAKGIYPVVITEMVTHAFPGSGTYTVTVAVGDDDGGFGTSSFTIHIP